MLLEYDKDFMSQTIHFIFYVMGLSDVLYSNLFSCNWHLNNLNIISQETWEVLSVKILNNGVILNPYWNYLNYINYTQIRAGVNIGLAGVCILQFPQSSPVKNTAPRKWRIRNLNLNESFMSPSHYFWKYDDKWRKNLFLALAD